MCLLTWNWQPNSATPLLLLSNRDEFYARPAVAVHWWDTKHNGTQMLAGRDQQGGGTWLGVSRSGRLAALTNFRSPTSVRTNTPSRGELVTAFLQDDIAADDYLQQLALHTQDYNPFNLLVFDGHHLMGLESRARNVLRFKPGLGAVSNADFLTPWPKLTQLSEQLQTHIKQTSTTHQALLPLLYDRTVAADVALPHTGFSQETERELSAIFVATTDYGTRACSVISIHHTHVEFTERCFGAMGFINETQHQFQF